MVRLTPDQKKKQARGPKNNRKRPRNNQNENQDPNAQSQTSQGNKKPSSKKGRRNRPEMFYQEGDRVLGMGSGTFQGKWYPGTIREVVYDRRIDTLVFKIEYDRNPGKNYPIRSRHLKHLDAETSHESDAQTLRKRKMIWGQTNNEKRDIADEQLMQLEMDAESDYSITHAQIADVQTHILACFSPVPECETCITDACAGVGGNAYSFSKKFKHVTAIERDTNRHKKLQSNMGTLKVADKVTCLNQNFVDTHSNHTSNHIVFMDVPWGGPETQYREKESVDLVISGEDGSPVHVARLANAIRQEVNQTARVVALKLPHNYNVGALLTNLLDYNIAEFSFPGRRFGQALLILDYGHGAKDFNTAFQKLVQHYCRSDTPKSSHPFQAEILRRRAYLNNAQDYAVKDYEKTNLHANARQFVPSNKRHALRDQVEIVEAEALVDPLD